MCKLIKKIINKIMSTVNKKLFSQNLVTDPTGYRIALGKNTVEDTKNFDAEALNNIRVRKYSVTWEDHSTAPIEITDIPLGSIIWDVKLSVSTAFDGDGAWIDLSADPDEMIVQFTASDVEGFVSPNGTPSIPYETTTADLQITMQEVDFDIPTEGVANLYIHYSILD